MRKVLSAAATATLLLSLTSLPTGAYAEPTPAPTIAPLSPMEQFRIDRESYFDSMREIALTFKASCERARLAYATSIASAKSKDQKRAARAALENSIASATILFESAKMNLGPEPVEPARVAKAPARNKSKSR